jgi:hypothetical protein
MNLEGLAFSLDFFGKFIIILTALIVHKKIRKEQKIDKSVLKEMKIEQGWAILGLVLMFLGYLLHMKNLFE